MKKIKFLLILVIIFSLFGCGGSSNNSNDSYKSNQKMEKILDDYRIYLNSIEEGKNLKNSLDDGIYIYLESITNNKKLHFYSMETLSQMDNLSMEELIKIISIEAQRKNVLVVVDDNYVDLFNYKSIDDISNNRFAPDIEIGTIIENSDNLVVGNLDNKLIIDTIREFNKSSFIITTRQNISEFTFTESELKSVKFRIADKNNLKNYFEASINKIIDNNNIMIQLDNEEKLNNDVVYILSSNSLFYSGVSIITTNLIEKNYITNIIDITNDSFSIVMNDNVNKDTIKIDDFYIKVIIENGYAHEINNLKISNISENIIKFKFNSVSNLSNNYIYKIKYNNQMILSELTYIIEKDTTKPVITLIGESEINLYVGDNYIEQGATAKDNIDGDITENIVITGNVNTNKAGEYKIKYNVKDSSGNKADEVVRTVIIEEKDTTKPVITLIGESEINLYVGDNYIEQGATAKDNIDGDITENIVITGNVNTNKAGEYKIKYNVKDSSGNKADEIVRTVIIKELEGFIYNNIRYLGEGDIIDSSSPETSYKVNYINIIKPKYKKIKADGYITLEGKQSGTGSEQYSIVNVIKVDTEEKTSYWIRGNFSKKLWLRFGKGEYKITVHKTEIKKADLNYEGDIYAWSYWNPSYEFYVENTRDEDGKFYYPSDAIQSDDPIIMEKAAEIVEGLNNDNDKIKAIHDWVAKYLYYDDDSLNDGKRKKQDAISAYNNKTGVCEGYTSLLNALLRASGYRVKAIEGTANGGGHAWSNILLGNKWYLIDVTWDDPGMYGDPVGPGGADDDPLGKNIRYTYYMLTTLTGVNKSHTPTDERIDRSIGNRDIYKWRGYPNGIY